METMTGTDPSTARPLLEGSDGLSFTTGQARQRLRTAPWRRVVVLGDSVAAGVGDPTDGYRELSWADRFVEALPRDRRRVAHTNLGAPGRLAARIRDEQVGPALAFRPDLALLSSGGNDMLRRAFDPARLATVLDETVGPLRRAGADVVVFSLLDLARAPFVPDELRADLQRRLRALADVVEGVARRHECFFVDLFHHPCAGDPSLYSEDRLHLNGRGHAVVGAAVIDGVARQLVARRSTG